MQRMKSTSKVFKVKLVLLCMEMENMMCSIDNSNNNS